MPHTPEHERFGRFINRFLPSSDTRGEGGAAPPDSGQQRESRQVTATRSVEEFREEFQVNPDEVTRTMQLLQNEIVQDKPKNFLDKSVLAGTKWGVVDLGGIKFVNPLKTFFSGLDWTRQNVASPISGYMIGNTSVWLSHITNWSSAGKIAQDFQRKLGLQNGDYLSVSGVFTRRDELKEFQEQRQNLFWGEKFITETIADPTSYIGFGMAAKLPAIGRLLGPLERGYIDTFNLPFKMATRAYGKGLTLPSYLGGVTIGPAVKSSRQKAVLHGEQVWDDTTRFLREAGQGKSVDAVTKSDILPVLAQVMDPSINYNRLPSNAARKMRDHLLTRPRLSASEASVAIANIAGDLSGSKIVTRGVRAGLSENKTIKEVNRFLNSAGGQVADDAGARFAMSEVRDMFVRGRLGKDEAIEQLHRIAGVPMAERSVNRTESLLERWATAAYREAERIADDLTPLQMREAIRSKALRVFQRDSDNAFHERMQRLGVMGGIVEGLDNFQNAVYQRGLRKWVIQPLAKAVLMFPLFPVQERMETIGRQMLGRSSRGYRTPGQFLRHMGNYEGVPSGLERAGQDILASRVATSRADLVSGEEGVLYGEMLGRFVNKIPGVEAATDAAGDLIESKGLGRVMTWLKPGTWLEAAQQQGAAGRRHYILNRAYQRQAALMGEEQVLQDVRSLIDSVPSHLPKQERQRLQEDLVLRVMTGNPNAVRDLVGDYTGEVISKVQARNLLDNWRGSNEWHQATYDIVEEALETGAGRIDIDNLVSRMKDAEFDQFTKGAGGFLAGMDVVNGQVREHVNYLKSLGPNATVPDLLAAEDVIKQSHVAMDAFNRRVERINMAAVEEASRVARSSKKKAAVFNKAQARIDEFITEGRKKLEEFTEGLRELEGTAFGEGLGLADTYHDEFSALIDTWVRDKAEVGTYFASQPARGQSFWDGLRSLREEIWTESTILRRQIQARKEAIEQRLIRRRGSLPQVQPVDLSTQTRYTIDDVAKVIGLQSENVTQAIMSSQFLNKRDFVDYVLTRGKVYRHTGLDAKRIGDVYERIAKATGWDQRIGTRFTPVGERIRQFGEELKGTLKTPSLQPRQEQDIANLVDRIAVTMSSKSADDLARIKQLGQGAVDDSIEDMKLAFVNYDDTSAVDDMMQSIFPFWTYESRRMPFLLRTSMTNPLMWQTFGPEGRYWDQTDNGYVHANMIPWMDMNPFGGTLFNAPRRLKLGDMPPEHTGGVRGSIASFEQQIGQLGFYAGAHMTFAIEALITGDVHEAIGESAPPPVLIGWDAAQWLLKDVPVIGSGIREMRNAVMPERFRNYDIAKIVWDMGFSPAEIDFETMSVRDGATITQDELNEALNRAAGVEWIREVTGVVRFRPEAERQYREAKDRIQMAWTGLSKTELEEAKRQKIPLTSIAPMPPVVARFLNELEGSEQFQAASILLSSGEKRRIQELTREMWEQHRALREEATAAQDRDNELWRTGRMSPDAWRDSLSSRKQSMGSFLDQLRGFKRDLLTGEKVPIDGEFRYREVPTTYEEYIELHKKLGNDTIRLQHPVSQAVEMYHSIAPVDRDGDGRPEFNEFFKAREALLSQLPAEIRRDVLEELDRNRTEPERALANLQRGILGRYWDIDEEVAAEMGVENLIKDLRIASGRDPDEAEVLRGLPVMSRYRKEVQRRKDLMRLESPELDYALNIFGFTGTTIKFKNPQAKSWWQNGDGVNRNVPWLGYLSGSEPPAAPTS